jgi:hypothetical protein
MRLSCAARSWWVPPIEGPSLRRTSAVAFSATDGECESTSDAPCHRTRRAETRRAQPEPLPPPPRQRTTAFTTQGAFHRRVLARRRFHDTSNASPPPGVSRTLPSWPGFRRFFASRKRKARHRRFRGLIARERSAPRAARRLLQSKPFASTTTDRRNSRLSLEKAPRLSPWDFLPGLDPLASLRRSGTEESWVRGRRSFGNACRLPSVRLLASEDFAPTQSARTPRVTRPRPSWLEWPRHLSNTPSRCACAPRDPLRLSPRGRGPPPETFREEGSVPLHPRCLPSPNLPLEGRGLFSTHCPQSVDYGPCAFSILARSGTLTRVRGPRRLNPWYEGGG